MSTIELNRDNRDDRGPFTAAGALLDGFVARVGDALRERKQRRINRREFLELLDQDERILADIGLTRSDVEWAAHLSVRQNASEALERMRTDQLLGR